MKTSTHLSTASMHLSTAGSHCTWQSPTPTLYFGWLVRIYMGLSAPLFGMCMAALCAHGGGFGKDAHSLYKYVLRRPCHAMLLGTSGYQEQTVAVNRTDVNPAQVRTLLGTSSYELFTLDKLVHKLINHMRMMVLVRVGCGRVGCGWQDGGGGGLEMH